MNWTPEQLAQRLVENPALRVDRNPLTDTPIKVSKYRAQRTTVGGITFDSKKEAKRWNDLLLLQRAGEITHLRRQEEFALRVNGILICKYRCDFAYTEGGKVVVEDVKSDITRKLPVYQMKKKLMKAIMGVEILET